MAELVSGVSVARHRRCAENAERGAWQSEVLGALRQIALNEQLIKVLNRLLEGFEGKLTTSKWAKLQSVHRIRLTAIS